MLLSSEDSAGRLLAVRRSFRSVEGIQTRMNSLARRFTIALGFVVAVVFFAHDASASGCDLFQTTSSCTFNGGVYDVVGPHPTGTGVIQSFLRVQQKGAEEGFNTDARPMLCDGRTCDDKTDPNFTRNLLSSAVPVVTINGTKYREFFLDINEPAGGTQNYLTLDQVEIFVSNTPSLTTHTSIAPGYGSLSG